MTTTRTRKLFAAAALDDECGELYGYVRYDGDPDVFVALAWRLGIDHDWARPIQPPAPRLMRSSPDPSGEYAWVLVPVDRPGRGVFSGALIRPGNYLELPEVLGDAVR